MGELLLGRSKGGHRRLIEVQFPILFYNYFRTLINGPLIEGGFLIRFCLMEVYLYIILNVMHMQPAQQAFQLGFGAKKDRGTGFSVLAAREMKQESKNESGVCLQAFPSFFSLPPPRSCTYAIFRAIFDSRSSFFAPKPHGNACYAGYGIWNAKCLRGGRPGGGTLGISGWGRAAGSLEPLIFTRASSATLYQSKVPKFPYPRVAVYLVQIKSSTNRSVS